MISETLTKLASDFAKMETSSLVVLREQITSVLELEVLENELDSRLAERQVVLGKSTTATDGE